MNELPPAPNSIVPQPVMLTPNSASDRALLMALRKSYLEVVDALERALGITPRTAEMRQQARAIQRNGCGRDTIKP